jgi:hypothetical protein
MIARALDDGSPQALAAKVAAAMVRLHATQPTYAEGIALFFHDPPAFGGLRVTVRRGQIDGVELTRTLSRA